MELITANQMVGSDVNEQKSFRRSLRDARLKWHGRHERWTVEVGSKEHKEMEGVFKEWSKRRN